MWLTLSEQTAYFLWSIVPGALAAALYDIVRAVRSLLRAGKWHVILSDVLFFVLCGIMTSLFALPFNKGSVRAFILFGELIGFLCYRLTLGQVMGRIYSIMSKGIVWFTRKICELLKNFFDLLLKTASFVLYNVGVVIDRSKQKVLAVRKKARKKRSRTVRNRNRRRVRKAKGSRRGDTNQSKRKENERRYKKEKKSARERGRDR